MLPARWLEKRKPHWTRLAELVERSHQRGFGTLSHRELQELGLLYRQTATDLATVREDPTSHTLSVYLNELLGRAHNVVYMGRRGGVGRVAQFYAREFPKVFRETFSYTLLAFCIFLAGTVVGGISSLAQPQFSRYILGPQMSDTIEQRKDWTQSIVAIKPLASSGIMTNNLSVAIATFASGILAGLGTLYMMFLNGILMGVILAACWQAGMLKTILTFIVGHGSLELPAIFIAGGAGLLLAKGLLFPGLLPRKASLAEAGAKAVRLFLGVVPLLIVAGIVEGFVSPSSLPWTLKCGLGAALFTLLVAYIALAGPAAQPVAKGSEHHAGQSQSKQRMG
jgi:uncharacterized membrane protein SpoIIM required for sporulation